MEQPISRSRPIENLHILLWLLKDTSWLHDWHWIGVTIIAPTIFVQLYITWANRRDWGEVLHNTAIVFWLIANSIWMIGEFFYNDGTRPIATYFFDIGLALIALYYLLLLKLKIRKSRHHNLG